ncbi:hypothetical protein PFISCL1PPCAC_9843, partial [Pristionchus fissidentatus]
LRCRYMNDDLVFVPEGIVCDTRPTEKPRGAQTLLQFVHASAVANFEITGADESSEEAFDYSRCSPFSTMKVFVRKFDHPLAKALAEHPAKTKNR